MDYKKLSIIIPAYAEEQNLPKLLNEIVNVFIKVKSIEIVIVDDGSPISLNEVIKHENGTWRILSPFEIIQLVLKPLFLSEKYFNLTLLISAPLSYFSFIRVLTSLNLILSGWSDGIPDSS